MPISAETILRALPLPTFVVDEDMVVLAANPAAKVFSETAEGELLNRRTGTVLRCVNAGSGCGQSPACSSCPVRNTVQACFDSGEDQQTRGFFRRDLGGEKGHHTLLVRAVLFEMDEQRRVLLILQDLTELTLLKELVRICSHCKNVRAGEENWTRVEEYFANKVGAEFTHGLCPSCFEEHYPE